jgi:diguanylate cyclase
MPAAIATFLFVNIACAFVALAAGFAAGVWFFGARRPAADDVKKSPAKPDLETQRASERTAMASGRLVDLAKSMATDVSNHAAKVNAITADLRSADRGATGVGTAVHTALDQILAANNQLQERLANAEKQIEAQAAEIRCHESEARTDSLTDLANRRAFDDEMRRRIAEWERKQAPFTLLILDIDHFKKFNDTHGHQVGDEVLRHVAKMLKQQCRDMDLPCRYGGEEFAVILPATKLAGACISAERIRKAIEDSVTNCEGKSLKVTASLGLAEVVLDDNPSKIIKRADEALYKSKQAGRNCGHWHDCDVCRPITQPPEPQAAPAKTETPPAETPVDGRLASRATFIQVLKRRVTESHRFGIPLSLIHIKIEEYESICRLYGQAIGRHALESAGDALEKTLREMDALARLDNGEFIAMLPGNTTAEAGQLVKRMRVALANCMIPQIDRELHLHFRHSIAELKAGETAQELLACARRGSIHWTDGEPQLSL